MAYAKSQTILDQEKKGSDYATAASKLNYDPNNSHAVNAAKNLNDLNNYKSFKYDVTSDALYQQYKDQYTTQGKLAMQDTVGQVSAMTGGYGNSYAQTAGQQTYNQYMGALADKIPELYELAYSKYSDEKNDLYNMYSLNSQMDSQLYDRAQVEQANNWTAANYWNTLASNTYNREYGEYQDGIANQLAREQFEHNKSIDDAEMTAAGYTKNSDGGWTYTGSGDSESSLTAAEYYEVIGNCAAFRNARDQNGLEAYINGLVDRKHITPEEGKALWNEYSVLGDAQVNPEVVIF